MLDIVLSEQKGSIRVLTLNRPDCLNAVNAALITALQKALVDANEDDDTSIIILKGAGRAFCTGNDMKESADSMGSGGKASQVEAHVHELQEITRQIVSSNKIVIGAIHGWAVGAGFEWAINCDFTIWAEGTRAFFPEVKWGLSPTGGVMTLLPRIVGIAKAREMLLFGEKYTASEMLDLGIAWRMVPDSELDKTALEAAEQIASLPQATVSQFKKTFNRSVFADLEHTLEAEIELLVNSLMSDETANRVKTFES